MSKYDDRHWRATVYLTVGFGCLVAIAADVLLYPRWWILGPLTLVLVTDVAWGIAETNL